MTGMLSGFLNTRGSQATQDTYRVLLRKFFRTLYSGAGHSVEELDPIATRYIEDLKAGKRDLKADILAGCRMCKAPKSGATLRSAVIEFVRSNDFFPDERTLYHLKKAREASHVITMDRPLGIEDALKILGQMDPRARAITLIMISSGARIGEVLNLKMGSDRVEGDIDLETRPARITLRETKTGQPRISFISQEAVAAVKTYLQGRDRYVKSAKARGGGGGGVYLFPITYSTFQDIWQRAVQKAGLEKLDPNTGRLTLTAHSCRKFFMSRMKAAKVPDAIVEKLVGHRGYLAGAYGRYYEEELTEEYLKGERFVTLQKAALTERQDKRIRELEGKLAGLTIQIEKVMETAASAEEAGRNLHKLEPIARGMEALLNKVAKSNPEVAQELRALERETKAIYDLGAARKKAVKKEG